MAGARFVDVLTSSRYKDTRVYRTEQFGPVFALMEPPRELLESREDETTYTVKRTDIGFLDHIAVRYYGPGSERFGWVIGLVNRIIDPDTDMHVGQILRIPSRRTVQEFQSRGGDG